MTILAAPAGAQGVPDISGEVETRVQSDFSRGRNDTFTKTRLSTEIELTEGLFVRSTVKLEPVRAPDGDRFFGDHGLWLDQLNIAWETDDFALFAGKLAPRFAFAYDKAPYIYGRDFVEDYETTEKIGAGGTLKLAPEGWGTHALTATAYFADATPLSNSAFSRPRFDDPRTDRPGRLRRRDGGVGNTGSLDSWAISLDGQKMPWAEGLEYTLGWRFQKRGRTERFDEQAFAAGLAWEIDLGHDLTLTPLVEYVAIDKLDGADTRARYATGALTLAWGPWSAATSYTSRRLRLYGEEVGTRDDRLFQLTLGYTFDFGLGLYLGWKNQKVDGVTSDTVGLMALYGFKF
ncbi:MAG: hypothetical protein AB7P02_15900 [Alphaproteobacteria bacterium]